MTSRKVFRAAPATAAEALDRLAGRLSPAQLHAAVRDVEGLVPLDVSEVFRRRAALPEPARQLLEASRFIGPIAAQRAQRFRRFELFAHGALYAQSGRTRPKALIVCFTGFAGRLMLPLGSVLQAIPSAQADVVVLSDPTKLHYLSGLPGVANTFPGLISRLHQALDLQAYQSIYTFGTSGGGFAALRAGQLLPVRAAYAVGGRFPWHIDRLLNDRTAAVPAFDPLCMCGSRSTARQVCIFSAGSSDDARDAQVLATIHPVELRPLAGQTHHNPLNQIEARGQLPAFFAELFEFDPARPSPWQRLLGAVRLRQ